LATPYADLGVPDNESCHLYYLDRRKQCSNEDSHEDGLVEQGVRAC
jgi:hypothetical protein